MVTETRTTIHTDRTRTPNERADTMNQTALWVVLAIIAFAGLGYAFYHYSNPANPSANTNAATTSSSDQSPAANDNSSNANGTTMNNDTSSAPNTGTPATNGNQPAATSDMPASTGTNNSSTNGQ